MDPSVLPVFLMLLCTVGLALGLLIVARVFKGGRPGAVQQMPYESGMDPIHDTRRRFDVRFHLLAIAFLIFDVELLFLFPWAVAWGGAGRETTDEGRGMGTSVTIEAGRRPYGVRSGPASSSPLLRTPYSVLDASHAPRFPRAASNRHLIFAGAMTFLVLLAVGYVYDWRKGVFQWR